MCFLPNVIVEGQVVDSKKNVMINTAISGEPGYDSFTVTSVKITNVLKGNVSIGDVIEIKQYENVKDVVYVENPHEIGTNNFFFLRDHREHIPNMPFGELNPTQCSYLITEDDIVVPYEGNKVFSKKKTCWFGAKSSDILLTRDYFRSVIEDGLEAESLIEVPSASVAPPSEP